MDLENSGSASSRRRVVGTPKRRGLSVVQKDVVSENGRSPLAGRNSKRTHLSTINSAIGNNYYNGVDADDDDDDKDVSPRKMRRQEKKSSNQKQTDQLRVLHKELTTEVPEMLIGRDKELSELNKFLNLCLDQPTTNGRPGRRPTKVKRSLYVSGKPGTGKTACVLKTVQPLRRQHRVVYLNCKNVGSEMLLFDRLANELQAETGFGGWSKSTPKRRGANLFSLLDRIKCALWTGPVKTILVLDEIDQVSEKVLSDVFSWPYAKDGGQNVCLIGIANALDEKRLPRAGSGHQPAVLAFKTYSADQLVDIIENRLNISTAASSFIDSTAVLFCAKKVANINGDARLALNLCSQELEECANENGSFEPGNEENIPTTPSRRVDVRSMNNRFNETCSTPADRQVAAAAAASAGELLDAEGQKVLATILSVHRKLGRTKSKGRSGLDKMRWTELYSVYEDSCQRVNDQPMPADAFRFLCTVLGGSGYLTLVNDRHPAGERVTLCLDESALRKLVSESFLKNFSVL